MDAQVWKRFIKNKATIVGSIILFVFFLMAILGPLFCNVDPNAIDLKNVYQYPSSEHLLGTDNLGRDMLTRIVIGARISLLVSFAGTIIGSLIGVILGVMAGYYGGIIDSIIARFVDILLAFPGLLLAIVVVAINYYTYYSKFNVTDHYKYNFKFRYGHTDGLFSFFPRVGSHASTSGVGSDAQSGTGSYSVFPIGCNYTRNSNHTGCVEL